MNAKRGLLAVFMVSLFVLPSIQPATSAQQSGYSEKIIVYSAGSSALWYLSIKGVNVSASQIAKAEGYSGLQSYNLTAIKTNTLTSDLQIFGPSGYNLLPLRVMLDQGLFLTLRASDASTASSVVTAFDDYLAASFVPTTNSSGSYSYYSPVSFTTVIPSTMMKLLSSGPRGFSSLISSRSFLASPSPMIILSGTRGPQAFSHALTLGSTKTGVVDSSGSLSVGSIFGSSSNVTASSISTSSVVEVHALDGLIASGSYPGGSTVLNHAKNYSASLFVTIPAGASLQISPTLSQEPPALVATRILDKGNLNPGDTLAVTLNVRNIGTVAVQNFTVDDGWWKALAGVFTSANQSSSISIPSIAPGETRSAVYVLRTNSSDKGEFTVPVVQGHFSYKFGSSSRSASVVFNQAQFRVGMVGPAITISASTDGQSNQPIGAKENFVVTVTNNGNGPALNLKVANTTAPSLAQGGQPIVVTVPVKFNQMTQNNFSRVFSVAWQTPEGTSRTIQSNTAPLFFKHSAMTVGFGRLTVNGSIRALTSTRVNVTLLYQVANKGTASIQSFNATQPVPAGFSCGQVSGSNITCSNGVISLRYRTIRPDYPVQGTVHFSVSEVRNAIFMPASYSFLTAGLTFVGQSGAFPAPVGTMVVKSFNPTPLFQGVHATVTIGVTNKGPYSIYNATYSSLADAFDDLPHPAPATYHFYNLIANGASQDFNYPVVLNLGLYGNRTVNFVTADFLFGGENFVFNVPQGNVPIYLPLSLAIGSKVANPVEGNPFAVELTITNPSPVAVSSVHLALPVPQGLQVVKLTNSSLNNGLITVDLPSLGGGRSYVANLTVKTSGGLTFDFSQGSLLFTYQNAQISGRLPSTAITVSEDTFGRYTLPIVIAVLGVLVTLVVLRRRLLGPTSPSSQQ